MLKIGEFAKICNVSTQTLRYYDAVGILCADEVDESNGYRYYKPEKIETYRRIVQLKELGFSLEEIKRLLHSSDAETQIRYLRRKAELHLSLNKTKELISQLETMRMEEVPPKPNLREQIQRRPFEDDPDVIGRWDFCGTLPYEPFGEDDAVPAWKPRANFPFPTLFFLPGGAFYWGFSWSRGTLFCIDSDEKQLVSCAYRILHRGEEAYLRIHWMRGADDTTPICDLLYRQVDRIAYRPEDARIRRDRTDFPFEADPELVGDWEIYDFIRDPSELHPCARRTPTEMLCIRRMQFDGQGNCVRTTQNQQSLVSAKLTYTRGAVLNKSLEVAEHYWFRTIGEDRFLLVEHKSGDYIYGGRLGGYYVFRKKK